MNPQKTTSEPLPARDGSPMPVTGEFDRDARQYLPPLYIPWAMLQPHDAQAKKNHGGQDLERLRARHGLSSCEALAILNDRAWKSMPTKQAHDELTRRIADWENDEMTSPHNERK